jgi:hypothetical protein
MWARVQFFQFMLPKSGDYFHNQIFFPSLLRNVQQKGNILHQKNNLWGGNSSLISWQMSGSYVGVFIMWFQLIN